MSGTGKRVGSGEPVVRGIDERGRAILEVACSSCKTILALVKHDGGYRVVGSTDVTRRSPFVQGLASLTRCPGQHCRARFPEWIDPDRLSDYFGP